MMMNIVVVASIYIEKKNERAREKKKKKKKKKKNEPPYITFSRLYSILSLPSLAFSPSILHDRKYASVRARALALQTIVVDSYGGLSDDRMLCVGH
jgi:hypothetical protein